MIAAGTPQAVALKITGHKTDAMFRRYAIVDEEQKREAIARTGGYLAAVANARKIVAMMLKVPYPTTEPLGYGCRAGPI